MLTMLLRKAADGIRLTGHSEGTDGTTVFGHACAMGLEGTVAKRRGRPYKSGRTGSGSRTRTRQRRRGSWNGNAADRPCGGSHSSRGVPPTGAEMHR
jgi:hypothetical protein